MSFYLHKYSKKTKKRHFLDIISPFLMFFSFFLCFRAAFVNKRIQPIIFFIYFAALIGDNPIETIITN